jgi:DNA-binding transcriptional LysR family regulator
MLPSSTDLHYFLELYKTKNISRAAERLGITQPSLSLSLKRLETLLDVRLFIRSKSGVNATKEADLLIKDVEKLLDDWLRVGERAKDARGLIKGNVRLGCHPSVAMYAVKSWIKPLLTQHKELEISFEHDLSRKILEQVVSFKLDLGLVINPSRHPDLVIKSILKDEVKLRKAKGKKVDLDTLIYDPALNQVQTLLRGLKKKKVDFKRHITTSNLEFAELLTSMGLGVGILPGKVCKTELDDYRPSLKPFVDDLCLIYRADNLKTRSCEVVIEAIKNAFLS